MVLHVFALQSHDTLRECVDQLQQSVFASFSPVRFCASVPLILSTLHRKLTCRLQDFRFIEVYCVHRPYMRLTLLSSLMALQCDPTDFQRRTLQIRNLEAYQCSGVCGPYNMSQSLQLSSFCPVGPSSMVWGT